MKLYRSHDGPLGYTIHRTDFTVLDLATRQWGPAGARPATAQLGLFARSGARGFTRYHQAADLGFLEPYSLADDARAYGCFRFSATSGHTIWSPGACITGSRVFSWTAFFRCSGTQPGGPSLISEGSSTGQQPLTRIRLDDVMPSVLGLAFRDDSGTTILVRGTRPVADGRWHHVAAVADGSTATLYLDGTADGTASLVGLGTTTVDQLCFGGLARASVDHMWAGALDDVRAYTRPLSPQEVASASSRWLCGVTDLTDCWLSVWVLDGAGVAWDQIELIPLSDLVIAMPRPGGVE